jgi:hypothetical protein
VAVQGAGTAAVGMGAEADHGLSEYLLLGDLLHLEPVVYEEGGRYCLVLPL